MAEQKWPVVYSPRMAPETLLSPTPSPAATADAWAASLHQRGLAFPAWILIESLRPFGWLASQALLLGVPLLRGVGFEMPLHRCIALLEDPVALAALSAALSPEKEQP